MTESLRVFRPCPLVTPKTTCSSLQMLAIARAMAVLCASIRPPLGRRSATFEKLSGSGSPIDDVLKVVLIVLAVIGGLAVLGFAGMSMMHSGRMRWMFG